MGVWLRASFKYLTYLNYPVGAARAREWLPAGVEPDPLYDSCYVSVVAMQVSGPRVLGVPFLGPGGFDRVLLQTYGRRRVEGEWRSGTVVLREAVSEPAVARLLSRGLGRTVGGLDMRHSLHFEPGEGISEGVVSYEWRAGDRWLGLNLRTEGPPYPSTMYLDEKFFVERFYGWDRGRERRLERKEWFLWDTKEASLEDGTADWFGEPYADLLKGKPESAYFVKGGEAALHRGLPL